MIMKRARNTHHSRDHRSSVIVEVLEHRRMLAVDVGVAPGVHLIGEEIVVPGGEERYDFELLKSDDLTFRIEFTHAAGNLDMQVLDDTMAVIGTANSLTDNEQITLTGLAEGSYSVRVYAVGGATNAYDLSIDPAGTSTTRVFYVNDTDQVGDVYTPAVGDDLNDGLTPLTPKATMQSVYDDYDIGPDDLILVDTGTYTASLLIEAADEGAIIAGSPNGSTHTASTAISLQDADFNLIYGLGFYNNSTAIYAYGDGGNYSTNNIYRNNFFDDASTAIRIDLGDTDLVEGNTIVNPGSYGVRLVNGGVAMVVRSNLIGGPNNAIYGNGTVADNLEVTIEDNTISGGTNGIYLASYTVGGTIDGNVVSGTSSYGIYATNETTITGNTVSGADVGILSQNAATTIVGNTVFDNVTGIYNYAGVVGGVDWSAGQPNVIHSNTTGLLLGHGNNASTARFNRIHGNVTGIETTSNSDIHHNVLYRNTGRAIRVDSDTNVSIVNNTIYAQAGDGVVLQNSAQNVTLTNNIIWSESGTSIYVATDSQRGFVSDYNNLYTTSGVLVWWQKNFVDIFDWQVEADFDTHSIGYTAPAPGLDNPLFVNLAGNDYHLQNVNSTSIDAGDPTYDFSLEPGPAGDRINLGAYGGTAEAATSRNAYVEIDYPNYYTDWEATAPNVILWHAYNVTGNVDIEVRRVGGGFTALIDTVDVTDGSYSWSPASSGIVPSATDRYSIRITSVANPAATDDSREGFAVPPDGPDFYIDDTDPANTNDEYTPGASGDNRSTGKTVLDPKANLLPMLRNYDLGPGDTVHIDTGNYIHVRNVILSGELGIGDDEGATFTGPTNLARVAQIDRANPYAESTNIELYDADFVALRNLTLTGGERGLWVHNGSTNFTGENLIVGSNSLDGIIIESDAEASDVDALTAMNNGRYGIHIATQLASVSDSFAYGNGSYGMYLENLGGAIVMNNEVYDNGSYGIYATNTTAGQIVVSINDVHDNVSRGISAWGDVLISSNDVYGHDGVNEIGIELANWAIAEGNNVYENYRGIITNHSGIVRGNLVHDNTDTGIFAFRGSPVTGNTVYSNGIGIRTDYWSSARYTGLISNNVVYDSALDGIRIEAAGDGARIWQNTIYETNADGIRIQDASQHTNLRNNIIWVDSNHGIYVANDSQTGFNSDYNLIYATGSGVTGYWQSTTYATLVEWRNATFNDAHSQARNPQFVNAPFGNFHLLSTSPAIDAGDIQTYYFKEVLSGGRANQGAYGNTDQATSSPAELVQVLYPNGDERLEEGSDYLLEWRTFGLTLENAIALINAGGETVGHYMFDDYFLNGGTGSTAEIIDTSGVTGPAPMAAYQTYRQAESGVGGTLDHHLAVPDGTYNVRLHFAETYYNSAGSRVFDIYAQGALEVDDYDIWADAGGRYAATTQDFVVVAAGGSGIDIQLVNETSAQAIIAAIEVTQDTAAGVANPTVDLDLSTDTGATWSSIAVDQPMDRFGWGDRLWTASPITPGVTGLIRASADDASMPTDVSDGPFEIVTPVNIYYVNDDVVEVGDWTTVAGNDAFDGRTPATPMASISAVLAAYDLEAGDVIKVDSGVYDLANNIIITANDAGVQIEGFHDVAHPGRQALLDRGNTAQNAIDVQSPDITLSYLWITGGRYGVNAVDADNLRVEFGKVYGNDLRGVNLDSDTTGSTIDAVVFDGVSSLQNHGVYTAGDGTVLTANEFLGHSNYAVYIYQADAALVVGNTIHDNASYGIYGYYTDGSEISGNTVYANAGRGISAVTTTSGAQTLVASNTVYDNGTYGIEASYNILVTGNEVYGHDGVNHAGIIAAGGAIVSENVVHGNTIGILTNHTATVRDNRVYNNTDYGIDARRTSSVTGNRVYSNGIGIRTYWWSSARFSGEVRNNIVYDNTMHGMSLGALSASAAVTSNTVYQLVGDAMRVESSSVDGHLSGNILVVDAGRAVFVADDSQTGFQSDYNLFHLTGTGIIGNWEGVDFTSRADWFYELGLDEHGRVADPLLLDPYGPDGLLGYEAGVDHGLDDDFHVSAVSPAIDAGSPFEYYFLEPKSGGRINIGAYGNTAEAALSPDESVQVLAPNGLEKLELNQSYSIDWRSFGLTLEDTMVLTNAGDGGTVGYWLYDDNFLDGRTTYTAEVIDTSGVANPADMAVYQTYRYVDGGVGDSLNYHIDLPNGAYNVRLHFAEHYYNGAGSRVFDIYAQGVLEVDDYDIWVDAGGRYRATTESFAIVAAGGGGFDLQLVSETAADAQIAAIEITRATAGGVANPTVELDLSTDGGATWSNIASGQAMDDAGRGSYLWTAGPVTGANTALIRARANDASMPTDVSDEPFLVANSGTDYYVNDDSLLGDVITSAAGDNARDGKTSATPMRSLRALLAAYDLDAGDTIHIDTGTYGVVRTIVVSEQDGGVTIQGPDIAVASFERGNDEQNVLDVNGDDVTLRYMEILGGNDGVYVSGRDGFTAEYLDVHDNDRHGLFLDTGSDSASITESLFATNGNDGVYSLSGDTLLIDSNEFTGNRNGLYINQTDNVTVTNNESYLNSSRGMYLYYSYGSLVEGNTVYENTYYGMEVGGETNQAETVVRDNVVHDNAGAYGMYVYTNLVAYDNESYGHTGTNAWGMYVSGATLRDNVVHGNTNGILTSNTGWVTDNRVYNNTNIGILAYRSAQISENQVYSNSIGIKVDWWSSARFTGAVENNLIYANSNQGLLIEGGGAARFVNNTIYQEVGDAVRVQQNSVNVSIASNIMWVADGYAIWVDTDSEPGFHSDHNVIHLTGVGKLGVWQNIEFTDIEDWRYELGNDQNSRLGDPQFIDIAGADGQLGYVAGTDYGVDDDFHIATTSPAVDAGDPDALYLAEPDSGGRVNAGRYGNTFEAAASNDELIHVVSPNGFEKFELGQNVDIEWIGWGLGLENTIATMNVGNNGRIGHWDAERYFLNGTSTNFTATIDTSGVAEPAPMSVYQSYRYAANGVGSTLDAQLPVPDGVYTLTLHFAEPSYNSAGTRVFDIYAEGILAADDYDIAAAAGARYIATTIDLPVNVVGGDGLTLQFLNETSQPALVNAIEVTAAAGGVANPTVDIELSTNSGGAWAPLAGGVAMGDFGRGSWTWPAGPLTPSNTALIRVASNDGVMPQDQSDNTFLIANNGADYYINDAFAAGDVLMTGLGDDANDGKTAATPMATLWALLSAYQLEAGDVIHVDTGDYRVLRNIEITDDDGRLTLQGESGAVATFDRMYDRRDVFTITGDHTTIDNIRITGGDDGINVLDAPGTTISRTEVFANRTYGIFADAASHGVTLSQNVVHDNGNIGLYVNNADDVVVSGNASYLNAGRGIYVTSSTGSLIANNVVHDNTSYGIEVQGVANQLLTTVSGNEVYANVGSYGMYIVTNVLATGNDVYAHAASNQWGVYVADAEVSQNSIHGNRAGVLTSTTGSVTGNRIFNNDEYGVFTYRFGQIRGNYIYSNSIGIETEWWSSSRYAGRIDNNLIYANTNQGIVVEGGGDGAVLINNTIYQEVGDAIRLQDSTQDVTIRNNILWVESGYAILVDPNSQAGFNSDYNLFQIGTDPDAHLGYFDSTDYDALALWQAATGSDLNSLAANAGLIDPDGADDVIGYSDLGDGYDGGPDDNFQLAGGSPAIDRGQSFLAPMTDIAGNPRVDDPGTPNLGGDYYAESNLGVSLFTATGTATGWRSNNTYWNYTLPFAFDHFGTTYTDVWVSTEGLLQFGGANGANDNSNSTAELLQYPRIAVLWDNLRTNGTGDDIYIDDTVANEVTIRWDATNEADDSDVNVAVTLFNTGEIQLHYGPGNTNLTPTVGISAGDGVQYLLAAYDGDATLTNANSIEFALEVGIFDIGAYEFQGSSTDTTPPTVTGTIPAAIDAATATNAAVSQIIVLFSEALDPIDANAPANYDLRGPGLDGNYDTGDDDIFVLAPSYGVGNLFVTVNVIGGPLPEGDFRFQISPTGSLRDTAGNVLDGDDNGTAGGVYEREFVVDITAPSLVATEINDGLISRSWIETIDMTFDEAIVVPSIANMQLIGLSTGTVDLAAISASLSYDPVSYTLTLSIPSRTALADDRYTLSAWSSALTDIAGNPIGGVPGVFEPLVDFHKLAGDITGDATVNLSDLGALLAAWDQSAGDPFWDPNADLDGDGIVGLSDLGTLLANFNMSVGPILLMGDGDDGRGETGADPTVNDDALTPTASEPRVDVAGVLDDMRLALARTVAERAEMLLSLPGDHDGDHDGSRTLGRIEVVHYAWTSGSMDVELESVDLRI
jgi:parallel beta-helix repeat protein